MRKEYDFTGAEPIYFRMIRAERLVGRLRQALKKIEAQAEINGRDFGRVADEDIVLLAEARTWKHAAAAFKNIANMARAGWTIKTGSSSASSKPRKR